MSQVTPFPLAPAGTAWLDRVHDHAVEAAGLALRGDPFLWPLLEGLCDAAAPHLLVQPELLHLRPGSAAPRRPGGHTVIRVWSADPDGTLGVSAGPRPEWCHIGVLRPERPFGWMERRVLDDVRRAVLAAVELRSRLDALAP